MRADGDKRQACGHCESAFTCFADGFFGGGGSFWPNAAKAAGL